MKKYYIQQSSRNLWLKIHGYLALILGLFFAVLGLTGSLSVYRVELDELLNPQLRVEVPSNPKYQTLDKILASVRAAEPKRTGSWTLEMPASPHGTITAWYDKPQESYFDYYAPLMVAVNPYTAEVVAKRFWGRTTMTWLLDLHTQLHLDGLGRRWVGMLGVLLLVSVMTGWYLWWPKTGQFWQAFAVRYQLGLARLAMDLHRLLGLVSSAALVLLALTGIALCYPETLEKLLGSSGLGHGNDGPAILSTARPNTHPVPLEAAEFLARGPFPRATLRRITTPVGDTGTYRVNLRQTSEINQKHPVTMVWVDRWSGHIKEVRDSGKLSWGETLVTWMWPLHTGEAFGATGRFLWFLAGLSPAVLYLSGLWYWLCKRGLVQDRKVSFAAVRPFLLNFGGKLQQLAFELGKMLLTGVAIARRHYPRLQSGLSQLARHWLGNRK